MRILEDGMRRVSSVLDGSPLRTLGMIAAIEITEAAGGEVRARKIAVRAYELGLFIRPLNSTIYLWPPLNSENTDLQSMVETVERAARETK
jgi:adenosylmethionine-8-amino-7-oxononanoate aminotransferase